MIPGFARHWDINGLVQALGDRPVLWTDLPLGHPCRYRYVAESNDACVAEFFQ